MQMIDTGDTISIHAPLAGCDINHDCLFSQVR